jgi:uncharacterized membrane protein
VTTALLIGLALLGPLAALRLERVTVLTWLNPVIVCYALGMLFGALVADEASLDVATILRDGSIPLAIPLLLFGTDLRALRTVSRGMLIAFVLAVSSVAVGSALGFALFTHVPHRESIAGMLVGVYTGGTPNMAAIGQALQVPEEVFVLLNASDVALGAAYLLALLTVARPALAPLFHSFEEPSGIDDAPEAPLDSDSAWRPTHIAIGLALAVVVLAASAGATWLVVGELHVAGVILGITTGGLLASAVPKIRALEGTYDAGNYLILVFCVAIGAHTDFATLAESSSTVFLMALTVMGVSVVLHLVLCRLARLDVETTLLASTAAVYGPPFVPLVAKALGNRTLVAPALCAGVLGYVVGNYLGLAIAWGLGALA